MRRGLCLLRPTKRVIGIRGCPTLHVHVNVDSRSGGRSGRPDVRASVQADTELVASSAVHVTQATETTVSIDFDRDAEDKSERNNTGQQSVGLCCRIIVIHVSAVLMCA